jgi:hypothetical protein
LYVAGASITGGSHARAHITGTLMEGGIMERKYNIDPELCGGPLRGNCPQCTNLTTCPHTVELSRYLTKNNNPAKLLFARAHDIIHDFYLTELARQGKYASIHLYHTLNRMVCRTPGKRYGIVDGKYKRITERSGMSVRAIGKNKIPLKEIGLVEYWDYLVPGAKNQKAVRWTLLIYRREAEIIKTIQRVREFDGEEGDHV